MALATATDWKTALFKILSVASSDIDKQTWVRNAGVLQADADQVFNEYDAWRKAKASRLTSPKTKVAK